MLTKKSKKLTLILFYSEFSINFLKVQSILKKVIEDLTPIGKNNKSRKLKCTDIIYINIFRC